ncbi:unnamed protein product [Heligmosomoides polygyrus]|uniref:Col_cuticle_N domain-containing protein n=1 Tax=Heligmosomoides polygyrus TaxID=6339 RepID=A0A183FF67_HELPZ|nr:unnamed protein product [Heligmosomoides polygyrus]
MRCAARVCLLGTCILIAIIYFAVHAANSKITETWDENDALARHLLEGADSPPEQRAGSSPPSSSTSLSASVAVVIVISLVSVSLLITGIIIVAVTIDPTNGADEESDIEWDSPSPRRADESSGDFLDQFHGSDSKDFFSGQILHEL